jgi:lipopolysaccharide export system protein LptC
MPRFTNSYTDRRQQLLLMLGRRSRFVFFSKVMLGCMILLLLGIITILPLLEDEASRITLASTQKGEELHPVMINPKFQGVDGQNQPFVVTATQAFHKDERTVVMEKIQADLTMKDTTWLALSANGGTMDLQDQTLFLSGDVKLFHDKGYEFTTEQVRIDTVNGNATGELPVQGQGVMGSFTAEQFSIFDRGERMILSGNVTMRIRPNAT